jgi:UDP-N-acetylmuramate: L-alanyl-gamma-D-glutamyl-meso-diaminopimelate ligase
VYDDFAHHPTAIAITIEALRRSVGDARIIAIFEPRSNTMRMGLHQDALAGAFSEADLVLLYQPDDLKWDLAKTTEALGSKRRVFRDIGAIVEHTTNIGRSGDHVVIMSNGSFGGLNDKLIARLNTGTRGN